MGECGSTRLGRGGGLGDSMTAAEVEEEVGVTANKKPEKSIMDAMIDCLPIELHAPGYQYLGPGTHLAERLERGDPGINPLDSFCREHDLAYGNPECSRRDADRVLAKRAFSRFLSETADSNEKTVALLTACCMVSKIYFDKIHAGIKKIKKKFKKLRRSSSSNGPVS